MAILDYIVSNKEWLLSGILVFPITLFHGYLSSFARSAYRRAFKKKGTLSGPWRWRYKLSFPNGNDGEGFGYGSAEFKHYGTKIFAELTSMTSRDGKDIDRRYILSGKVKSDGIICTYDEIGAIGVGSGAIVAKIHHSRMSMSGRIILVGGHQERQVLVYDIDFERPSQANAFIQN